MVILFLAGFSLLFPVAVAQAEAEGGGGMSSSGRTATLEMLGAVKKGQWSRAKALASTFKDPLALKIYRWMAYTKGAENYSFEQISSFVRENPDWPRLKTIRLNAEKAIPPDIGDKEIIAWFSAYAPLTPDGMERYLDALSRKGDVVRLRESARAWWKTTILTPDQQSRFYKKYKAQLDRKDHMIRFSYLIQERNYTNARAVARILGQGYPALAEARIAIQSDAPDVQARIAAVPSQLSGDSGLLLERLRWRRRHNQDFGALEILHNPPSADLIANPEDWWKERHIMARRMMEKGEYESAYLLVAKHQQKEGASFAQAEFLAGWLALKLKRPWQAFEHFETLYNNVKLPVSKSRGAYWAGRASDALGHPDIALSWYRTAARYQTTYYGQLALAALDDQYKPPQQVPPERSIEALNRFNRSELAQAARILDKAGFRKETGDFLEAMAEKLNAPEDYVLVADLAQELDHYNNAVNIAKKGLEKNIFMMEQAYPTMLSRMKHIALEWALVHAIIRQESSFDYDAQSPAGARGLMQLMPATAKETARKLGLPYDERGLTSRPDYNIRLGSAYMERMISRFDGSYILAAAAYNAGPGRVDQWLKQFGDPRKGGVDVVDWVEMIPVYETRNYVQRVMEGTYVYRIKLQGVQKSAKAPIHVAKGNF